MMKGTAAHIWTCLIYSWFFNRTDAKTQVVHVSCRYSEDCVLPCSFIPTGVEEIRWFRHDVIVHTHPQSADNQRNEPFARRMSVPEAELSLGNASLHLRRCALTDRGRYRCQVTKAEKTDVFYVMLKVEAPIRSVNLDITRLSGYEEVKCSTDAVYPAPHVFWATDPPTPTEKLKYNTRKMADQEGLYVMESKLKMLEQRSDLTYICIVNSSSSARWTASLTETVLNNVSYISKLFSFTTWTEIISAEGQDITIPCRSPWTLQKFTLTWSFTRANGSIVIFTYESETQQTSNRWNVTARIEPQRLRQGDGSLRLLAVRSLEHVGTYTCNISALQRNHVGETRVDITAPRSENENIMMISSRPWLIPVIVVIVLILIIAFTVVGILKLQKKCSQTKSSETVKYSSEVKVSLNPSEEITEGSRLTSDQSSAHT